MAEPDKPSKIPAASVTVRVKRRKTSQIAVKIPGGVDTGQRLKLSSDGEAGERGGPHGDLYVLINVLEHDFFSREGSSVNL